MEPSPAKTHMDLMAELVVEVIRTVTRLEIAGMGKSARACGVFVSLQDSRLEHIRLGMLQTCTAGRQAYLLFLHDGRSALFRMPSLFLFVSSSVVRNLFNICM